MILRIASFVLAALLLFASADPAHAQRTAFSALVGAANPLNGQDAGGRSKPAIADLDADGDQDVVAGSLDGTFSYFENTGTWDVPVYVKQIGAANPFDGLSVIAYAAATLADVDGDGDFDFLAGGEDGAFRYFENLGNAVSPTFVEQTGSTHPLDGEDVGDHSTGTFGDLDRDGDLDFVSGELGGGFFYYENVGFRTSPVFVQRTGAANPFDGENVGPYSTPALGDVDGDADLDLVVGDQTGDFSFFENTGSVENPVFTRRIAEASPLDGEDVGTFSAPALGDLDGDGDLDLASGEFYGGLLTYENHNGRFVARSGTANPLDGVSVFNSSQSTFGDLDGDGDLDCIAGNINGIFSYLQNTGTQTAPVFVEQTGSANPLDGEDVGTTAAPVVGDLDKDGDLDLIVASVDLGLGGGPKTIYYENTGSPTSPTFVERTGAANPLDGESLGGFFAQPTLGDLDGDGDLDLLSGALDGYFYYYENTGSPTNPVFVEQTGAANPLDGEFNFDGYTKPTVGDFDLDGDLDVLSGDPENTFTYYENKGSRTSPVFVRRTGTGNPFDGEPLPVGSVEGAPTAVDLDGDGDLDIVAGNQAGVFNYFESAIVHPGPFLTNAGAANPLAGVDVGSHAIPNLGDFDADGDLDLLVGSSAHDFRYYENVGSATMPVFLELSGAANPMAGILVGSNNFGSIPMTADVDADGDLDVLSQDGIYAVGKIGNLGDATNPLFVYQGFSHFGPDSPDWQGFGDFDRDGDPDIVSDHFSFGTLAFYENTGVATSANIAFWSESIYTGVDLRTPASADLDRDGDLDLVVGTTSGLLVYVENLDTTTNPPTFVARTGNTNPFDGLVVSATSYPAFGDLDGDGDLDLIVGGEDGTFETFFLPEPHTSLQLGWGLGFLILLERLRSRGRVGLFRPFRRSSVDV